MTVEPPFPFLLLHLPFDALLPYTFAVKLSITDFATLVRRPKRLTSSATLEQGRDM